MATNADLTSAVAALKSSCVSARQRIDQKDAAHKNQVDGLNTQLAAQVDDNAVKDLADVKAQLDQLAAPAA